MMNSPDVTSANVFALETRRAGLLATLPKRKAVMRRFLFGAAAFLAIAPAVQAYLRGSDPLIFLAVAAVLIVPLEIFIILAAIFGQRLADKRFGAAIAKIDADLVRERRLAQLEAARS